jgi:hypothetical protein
MPNLHAMRKSAYEWWRNLNPPRGGDAEVSPSGCGCLLAIWLGVIIVNALGALIQAANQRLAHVDWKGLAIASLALICFTGLVFLIYLPIADWFETRRRRREWRKQHDLDIEFLAPPPGQVVARASGRRGATRNSATGKAPDAPGVCPYCQTPIAQGEEEVHCPACRTPHHRQCWQENGGCAVYGCRGGKFGAH